MTLLIRQHKTLHPIRIRLLGADAILFQSNLIPNLVQQTRGFGACPWGAKTDAFTISNRTENNG